MKKKITKYLCQQLSIFVEIFVDFTVSCVVRLCLIELQCRFRNVDCCFGYCYSFTTFCARGLIKNYQILIIYLKNNIFKLNERELTERPKNIDDIMRWTIPRDKKLIIVH